MIFSISFFASIQKQIWIIFFFLRKKSRWKESIWMLTSLKFIHGSTADKDMWWKHSINQTWNNKKDSILSATVSGFEVECQWHNVSQEENGPHRSILIRFFLHVYCVITDAMSLLWFLYPYTHDPCLGRILWFYSSDFRFLDLLAHFWLQLKPSAAFVQFDIAHSNRVLLGYLFVVCVTMSTRVNSLVVNMYIVLPNFEPNIKPNIWAPFAALSAEWIVPFCLNYAELLHGSYLWVLLVLRFFCLLMFHCLTDIFAASHLEWSQSDEHCDEIDGRNIQMWIVKGAARIQALCFLRFDYSFANFVCDSPHFGVIDSFIRFDRFRSVFTI